MADNTISAIVAQQRKPCRCSIFVDGEYAFACSYDLVLEFALKKGGAISDDLRLSIERREQEMTIRRQALAYVAYKPRTEMQVRTRLRQRNCDDEQIDAAVRFLYEFAYLDDAAYARAYISSVLQRKACGPARLRQDLLKRGVPADICSDALAATFPDEETHELARAAARKKLRAISHKPREKQHRAVTQYLQRQGFGWETIRTVLKEELGKTEV